MGCMEKRRVSPFLFAVVVVAAALLVYVGGYFGLSNPGTITSRYGTTRVVQSARIFPNKVLAAFFRPAAAIESFVSQKEVLSSYQSE